MSMRAGQHLSHCSVALAAKMVHFIKYHKFELVTYLGRHKVTGVVGYNCDRFNFFFTTANYPHLCLNILLYLSFPLVEQVYCWNNHKSGSINCAHSKDTKNCLSSTSRESDSTTQACADPGVDSFFLVVAQYHVGV